MAQYITTKFASIMKSEDINARNAKHYWDLVQSVGADDDADSNAPAPAVKDEEEDEEKWVKEYLSSPSPLPRYTKEEMRKIVYEATAYFEAGGEGVSDEDVWRELEEEFAAEDAVEEVHSANLNIETDYMLEAV